MSWLKKKKKLDLPCVSKANDNLRQMQDFVVWQCLGAILKRYSYLRGGKSKKRPILLKNSHPFYFIPTLTNSFFVAILSVAIVTGCSPSCGADAFCQQTDDRPVCACDPGYEGDGYNCAGWCLVPVLFEVICSLRSLTAKLESYYSSKNEAQTICGPI